MTYKQWCKDELGYDCITTFFDDFSIAEEFDTKGIEDTFKMAFDSWKCDYKYLTELCMVLNHKMWFKSNNGFATKLSKLYQKLWEIVDKYCVENLKKRTTTIFLKNY